MFAEVVPIDGSDGVVEDLSLVGFIDEGSAMTKHSLNEIRLVQGQTKKFRVMVRTQEGRKKNLQGATVYASIYQKSGESVLVAKKSPDDGIKITNAKDGEATITLDVTDTELDAGHYRYDVWIEFSGDPPERYPVVQFARLYVVDRVTSFE